jgi:hypothetical protein
MKEKYDTPRCFNSYPEFKLWVTAARGSHPTPGHGYCEDCTPAYKDQMVSENRCGYPEVTFKVIQGEFVGRRSREYIRKLRGDALILKEET